MNDVLDKLDDPALIAEFVAEAHEQLEAADVHLLALEANPAHHESLHAVFRIFHTLKGVAGFFQLDDIVALAHDTESLFDRARSGEIVFQGPVAHIAFATTDLLQRLVDAVPEAARNHAPLPFRDELETLRNEIRAVSTNAPAPAEPPATPSMPAAETIAESPVPAEPTLHPESPTPAHSAPSDGAGKETIRVDRERLDRLIDTIGELVIAESIVLQDLRDGVDLQSTTQKLVQIHKTTRELQDLSLSMRMVPFRATAQKLSRLVRDLAHKVHKDVELLSEGEDTELDKSVLDRLQDPLVHLVRNAVDHGIEKSADERRRVGKPARGRVIVRAYHRDRHVVVEIEDDGRGLDRAAILAQARQRGLLRDGERDGVSDRDACELIFLPGLSTATEVTDVSGRGVGLDVVRRNLDALRGRVEIESQPGRGTRFVLRLPLTLAIIDGMVVRVGANRFILPTTSIREFRRLWRTDWSTVAGRGELLKVHERFLPLFRLASLFHVRSDRDDPTDGTVLIVDDHRSQAALLVDEVLGQQQVVIKPMSVGLESVPGVLGAAILPDGCVGWIVDTRNLSQLVAESLRDSASRCEATRPQKDATPHD